MNKDVSYQLQEHELPGLQAYLCRQGYWFFPEPGVSSMFSMRDKDGNSVGHLVDTHVPALSELKIGDGPQASKIEKILDKYITKRHQEYVVASRNRLAI